MLLAAVNRQHQVLEHTQCHVKEGSQIGHLQRCSRTHSIIKDSGSLYVSAPSFFGCFSLVAVGWLLVTMLSHIVFCSLNEPKRPGYHCSVLETKEESFLKHPANIPLKIHWPELCHMLNPEPLIGPRDGIILRSLRHLEWRSLPQTTLLLLSGKRAEWKSDGRGVSCIQNMRYYSWDPLQNENIWPVAQNFVRISGLAVAHQTK